MIGKYFRYRVGLALGISLLSTAALVPVSGVGADDCTLPGEGTADFPYFIRTADDLALLAGNVPKCGLDKDYLVLNDITLGADWPGISIVEGEGTVFTGTFDGGGNTITIGSDEDPAQIGLFGIIALGEVTDTNVVINLDATFTENVDGGHHVGGLVGEMSNAAIVASSVTGTIVVDARAPESVPPGDIGVFVGGLVGTMKDAEIFDSTANIAIFLDSAPSNLSQSVGGLVGFADGDAAASDLIIDDSYVLGEVEATEPSVSLGGLIGLVSIPSTSVVEDVTVDIVNTYTAVSVTPYENSTSAGGFIGVLDDPDDRLDVDASFWSSFFAVVEDAVTDFTAPIDPVAGLEDLDLDEITDVATFDGADWLIVDGWAPSSSVIDPDFVPEFTWGICDGVNGGTPYLLWEYPSDPCTYRTLTPERFMDTRPGTPATANPDAHATGPIEAGDTFELGIAGFGDMPFDAGAVSLTLTVVGADADGFATVWPCDEERPETSSVNFVGVGTIANTLISGLDLAGQVCIYLGQASANVLVDVNGYFPLRSDYVSLDQPERLMDTREGTPVTLDPDAHATGPLQPGEEFELTVAGLGDIPGLGVASVVLNVTAVEAQGQGFLTVWPCGEPQPETSNLNFVGVTTIANAVIANLGGGQVCLATEQVATDVIVDVAGYFPDGSAYHGVEPTRVFDSRQADDGGEKIEPGRQIVISPAANDSGVPLEAHAAVLNVTITEADGEGFATVWPCGEPQPETSNVNFVGVTTIANAVIARVGAETEPGQICMVLGQVAAHVVVDVSGYFD